jgi:predicted transcriptional regulator
LRVEPTDSGPPSRLRERAEAGDAPPPGTRVVVARIQGEATDEEAAAVSRALVGLRGEIVELVNVQAVTVKLDGTKVPVHFGWDELELEDNYESKEGSDARSASNG